MAEFTLSGYKASAETALTTELNALANGSASVLSAEIDNSTNKYLYADMELNLASLTPTAGGFLSLYLVASVDGTNYPLWDAGASPGTANNNYLVGTFSTKAAAAAQRLVMRDIELPPGKYKFGIYNGAGVALAASSNTLSWRPYNTASA
jgi:hypothetical protein